MARLYRTNNKRGIDMMYDLLRSKKVAMLIATFSVTGVLLMDYCADSSKVKAPTAANEIVR